MSSLRPFTRRLHRRLHIIRHHLHAACSIASAMSHGAAAGINIVRTVIVRSMQIPEPIAVMMDATISARPTEPAARLNTKSRLKGGFFHEPFSSGISNIVEKRIVAAFFAKASAGTMAAQKADIVAQRQQLFFYRANECGVITARQVSTTD